jgi:MarR family transcriptional regulator, organic hydroperoxide resistance regulator
MVIEQKENRDFTLWAMIIRTRDAIFKARDNELSQYGITAVEARALYIISLIGEQATPAMISRWMLREHNTVTALLTRMEKKGFITKTKDPEKLNSWRIALTKKGMEAYQNSLIREAISEVFTVLTNEEREVVINSLQKVCDQTLKYIMGVPTVPD